MPKCPVCGSTNISQISTLNRAASVATVDLLRPKSASSMSVKVANINGKIFERGLFL